MLLSVLKNHVIKDSRVIVKSSSFHNQFAK